jgi:uncharacterized Tic20 family protein
MQQRRADSGQTGTMAQQGGTTPPGWYPDGQGNNRWWDGTNWGPVQGADQGSAGAQPEAQGGGQNYGQGGAPGYAQGGAGGYAGQGGSRDPVAEGKTLAILLHIFGILALIFYFTTDNPFVKKHAREALNEAITFAVLYTALVVVGLILGAVLASISDALGAIWFLLLALAYFGAFVGYVIFAIQGAMAANRGEDYRYPYSYRLIKD